MGEDEDKSKGEDTLESFDEYKNAAAAAAASIFFVSTCFHVAQYTPLILTF